MAEETDGAESGGEAAPGIDPAAMALALGSASRNEADAFLRDQRALIAEQRHHLRRQYTQLGLGIWQMRLGVLLRIATAFIGGAIAAAFVWLAWNAAHSNGLVMEPFSVPADLAQKGLTGEVMADDLSGRISDMLARFSSYRAPQSYANNFGAGIKIEIPETGVSLSEVDRFLREKLGHDVHITGAAVHTSKGLKLTVRAGELGNASVEGSESDLEPLQQRLAEAVFGITQPYRFGVYLDLAGRDDEGKPVFERLMDGTSLRERAWGYVGLGNGGPVVVAKGDAVQGARDLYLRAIEIDPGNGLAMHNLGRVEMRIYPEQGLAHTRKFFELLARPDHGQIDANLIAAIRLQADGTLDQLSGAFHEAAQKATDPESLRKTSSGQPADIARAQRGEHDLRAARATMANPVEFAGRDVRQNESERLLIAYSAEDWSGVLRRLPALEAVLAQIPSQRLAFHLDTEPYVAIADAMLGRFADAERRVADMPADCYPCLIARAQIAALQGQHARADWWFDRAVKSAPSIPFAEGEWGAALLARGQPDAAIAKFTIASRKGPHFADPLEMWGEALMAKNQSHLALAKFGEANKYAPNWGRLHLKWGEALVYAGKKDEAQKQYAAAATLDLTAAEKAELAGMNHGKAI
jgi:tetratricopeptide (TPR) repeat protein